MKTAIRFTLFLMVLGLTFASCKSKTDGKAAKTGDAVETNTTKAADAVTYMVDPAKSQIIWTGA
ncbi:MAG: hypothetical protein AB8F74_20465, partial [Saprospiraceae bacterium]